MLLKIREGNHMHPCDLVYGLDGYLAIPTHAALISEYVLRMYDTDQRKTRLVPKFRDSKYIGVELPDYNIKTNFMSGVYIIEYIHPITRFKMIYVGTTINKVRSRIGKFVRAVIYNDLPESEDTRAAKIWRSYVGRTLEYSTVVFYPLDYNQDMFRGSANTIEAILINYLDANYDGVVLNTVKTPTKTLQKRTAHITPALEGI